MAHCHGCNGKGWIETAGGAIVHICPICKGAGWLPDITSSNSSLNIKELENMPEPIPERTQSKSRAGKPNTRGKHQGGSE